jgi:hypothetical protein
LSVGWLGVVVSPTAVQVADVAQEIAARLSFVVGWAVCCALHVLPFQCSA